MTDPTKPSNRHSSELADELRRLLAATPAAERTAAVSSCERAKTQKGVPEEVAHQAMTLAEIYRAGVAGMAETKLQKLVLVIHGIRDQGEWMEMVKERLQSPDVVVQPIDFEDFDAFRFMTGIGVAAVIKRVLAKIRQAKADHVGAELLVIAHSFGTFVVARILRDEPDIRFERAIFCGSVIPRDFRFDRVPHCPKIVNECGGRNIWPVVARGFRVSIRNMCVFCTHHFRRAARFPDLPPHRSRLCGHSSLRRLAEVRRFRQSLPAHATTR